MPKSIRLQILDSIRDGEPGPARIIPISVDRKLSPTRYEETPTRPRPLPIKPNCAATYVSIEATCPDSCRFKASGCYAEDGFTRRMHREMDRARRRWHPNIYEAELIKWIFRNGVPQDGARGGRDLRLHVGGEALDTAGAEALAEAATFYQQAGGGAVWTFTHRWREIPRSAWGPITVRASIERASDAVDAALLGYPAALVQSHPLNAVTLIGGIKFIPCAYETKGIECVRCRLCLTKAEAGAQNPVVVLAIHGARANKARRAYAA